MAEEVADAVVLEIDQLAAETIQVPIVGTAPLIVHKFSEKAKRQMLANMQGKASVKTIRDPQADYESAFHYVKGGGYGFPVTGFKQATVSAARFYDKSVTMVGLRQDERVAAATRVDHTFDLVGVADPADVWERWPLQVKRSVLTRWFVITVLRGTPGRRPFDPASVRVEFRTPSTD